MEIPKGFIEVTMVLVDKEYKKSINISHIISFVDKCIMTTRILYYEYSSSYTEWIEVKESYEEITQLIINAQK